MSAANVQVGSTVIPSTAREKSNGFKASEKQAQNRSFSGGEWKKTWQENG